MILLIIRARKKAVNLRVEPGDKGVTSSPNKVRKEKSHKKTKVQEEPVEVLKDPMQSEEAEPSYCSHTCY